MRTMTLMTLLGLSIAGCTNPCDENPNAAQCADADTDTDTDSDTDADADADRGTMEVKGYLDGQIENCLGHFSGPESGEIDTSVSNTREVLVGEYVVTAGGSDDCGGVPCHPGSDGNLRVSPAGAGSIAKELKQTFEFNFARYFDAEYVCKRTSFVYDASNPPSYKGDQTSVSTDPKQRLQVVDGYKIKPYEKEHMYGAVGTGGNYLEVVNDASGDHVKIVEVGDQDGRESGPSEFGSNYFQITIVEPNWAVTDLKCTEEQ